MKKNSLLISLCLLLTVFSCKKDNDTDSSSIRIKSIVASWNGEPDRVISFKYNDIDNQIMITNKWSEDDGNDTIIFYYDNNKKLIKVKAFGYYEDKDYNEVVKWIETENVIYYSDRITINYSYETPYEDFSSTSIFNININGQVISGNADEDIISFTWDNNNLASVSGQLYKEFEEWTFIYDNTKKNPIYLAPGLPYFFDYEYFEDLIPICSENICERITDESENYNGLSEIKNINYNSSGYPTEMDIDYSNSEGDDGVEHFAFKYENF
jgi:hypothetical protein